MTSDQELSKFQRASKLHKWFKSYGNFIEGVELHWEGSATAACIVGLFNKKLYKKIKNKIKSEKLDKVMKLAV